jgi:hypothetical protein
MVYLRLFSAFVGDRVVVKFLTYFAFSPLKRLLGVSGVCHGCNRAAPGLALLP